MDSLCTDLWLDELGRSTSPAMFSVGNRARYGSLLSGVQPQASCPIGPSSPRFSGGENAAPGTIAA